MGGVCWSEAVLHQNVHKLPNQIPAGSQYLMHESHSVRFSEVTVNRTNPTSNPGSNNEYKFVMKILSSSLMNETISVNLIILNENIQKLLTDNYQLKIQRKMIIDIFNKKLSTTLIQAKNQKTGMQFSVQIFAFRGYTSQIFKKCLYTLYILKKRIAEIQNSHLYYHKLIDHFVYGCNPDKQALALLFERTETSLANIAQYRKLASWPWTTQQKLKIFIDIMDAVYCLHKKKIFHRDIRPSNIFYIERLGRYVLGSFSKCIEESQNSVEEHNRTMYGIQYMYQRGCDNQQVKKIGEYIKTDKQYAPYSPKNIDYHGLNVILHTLETLDIINLEPNYKDKVILSVHNEFHKIYDTNFEEVRQKILKIAHKYDIQHLKLSQDNQISTLVHRLASITHRQTIQTFTFQVYDTMGYEKQFSNTTHQLIQKNNEQNKSLQNAYLLKNLGEFFQRNGAKGTQYYCNACLLFLKRAEKQLNFENLQLVKEDYYQAQKCYIKFSQNFQSHSIYIELHRVKALIKMHDNEIAKALEIIKQTFEYAAKKKISIEKQMTLLLAYAKIHLKGNPVEKQIGEEKLKNGLAICQNKAAFQHRSSCDFHTANFLFELGALYHNQVRAVLFQQMIKKYRSQQEISIINPPLKEMKFSADLPKLKALTESNLRSCLEITEKQSLDVIDIVKVLKQLGSFYYDVQLFVQAKKTFDRCETLLKDISKEVSPIVPILCLYSYGSTLYSLKEFADAQKKYERSLQMFKNLSEANDLLKYNIQGNLGLVQIQLRKNSGEKRLLEAMNEVKRLRSEKFYDYVFLKQKYSQIKNRKKKKN